MKTPTPIPNPVDEPFVSVEEAGRMLGLGRDSAYRAVSAGTIPSIRVGRNLRIPTAALRRMAQIDPGD